MKISLQRVNATLWPLALAALIAAVALSIAMNAAWPLRLDVGGQDRRFISGMNAPEVFGASHARWTTGQARIALPRPPDGAPLLLTLRLINARPAGLPGGQVILSAGETPIAEFAEPGSNGARRYRLLAPGEPGLTWRYVLEIYSDSFTLPNDPRQLGVAVDELTIAPLGSDPRPAAWLALWAGAIGALGYALLRAAGLRGRAALAGSAALSVALAVAARLAPLEVLPFLQRLALLLALGWLGLRLMRLFAPHRQEGGQTLIRGRDLPILLALAWWCMPVFQWIMTLDGAANVTPPAATSAIGVGVALALAGLVVWSRRRGGAAWASRPALIVLALAAGLHLAYMLWFAFQRQGPDFWILFKGAREWTRGGSLYDLAAVTTNHFGAVFKVPPFYGMLFVPFVAQDGERILFFHRLINLALIGVAALAWMRIWGIRPASLAAAGVLILFNVRPLADTLAFGQIDLALLVMLILALGALRRGHDTLAGALIALATLFKIYPILLLGFLLAKRRWRGFGGFALGMLLSNGVAIAVMGWEMHRVYLFEVLPRIGGTTAWVENQTLFGFLARLVATPTEASILHDGRVLLAGYAIGGALTLLACAAALAPAPRDSTGYALQFSLFPLLMVFVVPAAWMHYETLLVIPFGVLLLHLREREIGLGQAALLALSFALVGYGNQWSFYDGTVYGALTIAGISYKCYGMALLAISIATVLRRERRETARLPRDEPRAIRPIARPAV